MAVSEVTDIDALYGAELAVICAPNNPTGTQIGTDALAEIARHADMVLLMKVLPMLQIRHYIVLKHCLQKISYA